MLFARDLVRLRAHACLDNYVHTEPTGLGTSLHTTARVCILVLFQYTSFLAHLSSKCYIVCTLIKEVHMQASAIAIKQSLVSTVCDVGVAAFIPEVIVRNA